MMSSLIPSTILLAIYYLTGIFLFVARLDQSLFWGSTRQSANQNGPNRPKRTTSEPRPSIHRTQQSWLFDRPCTTAATREFEFCNTSLPIHVRVSSLLSNLTLSEKIGLLGHRAAAIPRLSIPPYQWWNEALHGVASYDCCPPHRVQQATCFPQVNALGVSFNRTLYQALGTAIRQEAIYHFTSRRPDMPGLTYWTPNVNLFRDPRWGRGQEVTGEDPYLSGQYAYSLVRALQQRQPHDDFHLAVSCKHFYGYSLETGRESFNAVIQDQRDLEDSYLPAFEKCVEAGVMGIMCSYNAVNGVPACADEAMLRGYLREEHSFDGYIVGDCGAVQNIYQQHEYVKTPQEAVAVALQAGVDLDCGDVFQQYGETAVQEGLVAVEHVDRATRNLLQVQFRLGYYNGDGGHGVPHWNRPQQDAASSLLHNTLALDAARQGVVLLKNLLGSQHNRTASLPLSHSVHKTIALLGPNANATTTMQGNYYGGAPFLVSPKQGLEDLGVRVLYEKGSNVSFSSKLNSTVDGTSAVSESMCRAISSEADATVLVVGLDQSLETEGLDRVSLELPLVQHELIEEAVACRSNKSTPIVLIVMSGGPIDLNPYKSKDDIDAILYVGYPGQSGGTALAEAMYGLFSPSGRLTTTIYHSNYADQVEQTDMRMRPRNHKDTFPGRTYRFYVGPVVYPFGFGLSYSDFSYTNIVANFSHVFLDVTNNGPMDAAHTILLFHVGPDAGDNGNPLKSLVEFEKLYLAVGEGRRVLFELDSTTWSRSEGSHTLLLGHGEHHNIRLEV